MARIKPVVLMTGLFSAALLLVFLFKGAPFFLRSSNPVSAGQAQNPAPGDIEIPDYKGEKLGLISDFHENSIKGPQKVDPATYRLTLKGSGDQKAVYTYEEVLKLPHFTKVITLHCVEGWSVKVLWEGVKVSDLLARLDPAFKGPGPQVKEYAGRPLDKWVVKLFAKDGYSTSLPLKTVLDRQLLLAYRMNGITLPPDRGFPFQLVAEDKWGYKWIKWVQSIELSTDTAYKGYWETRGYNQNGDHKGSVFDE